jgi:hypothetical protein
MEDIRIGQPDDIDDMMALATAASDENGFLPAHPGKMLQEIYSALCLHRGIVGIIGPKGAPEGAVLIRIGEMWYSFDPVVEEKAIFVHPDYRSAKGGRAGRLCEFSKHVADTLGLPLVIGVLSNSRTQAKVRLYQRKFGPPAGAFFIHGAVTGQHKASN